MKTTFWLIQINTKTDWEVYKITNLAHNGFFFWGGGGESDVREISDVQNIPQGYLGGSVLLKHTQIPHSTEICKPL